MKINEFIKYFCEDLKIEYTRIKNDYYLASEELIAAKKMIDEHSRLKIKTMGMHLGSDKGLFKPTLAFLNMLAGHSKKKIFLNTKGEWLFVCKRDIMKDSIDKINAKNGLVLIQNQWDENLGLGRVVGNILDSSPNKVVIKNVMNTGEYLGK